MKQLTLLPQKDYGKLYFFLKDECFSESLISALRKSENAMKINGVPVNMRSKIKAGDKVEIAFRDEKATALKECDLPLEILFENEDLLVVNKPAGLPTIPSRSHFDVNLAGAVAKYMSVKKENFVFRALGRLDKDTSGVVIIAKNQYAAGMTTFKKTYLALCHGEIKEKTFSINAPILTEQENNINAQKRVTSAQGKSATTHAKVLKTFNGKSLLELTLEQGRTHQIRVHLSSLGHPLVGDSVYGSGDAPRTMLHAYKAEITLPSKEQINITAPLPDDFLKQIS